jgi:hypothetical protein
MREATECRLGFAPMVYMLWEKPEETRQARRAGRYQQVPVGQWHSARMAEERRAGLSTSSARGAGGDLEAWIMHQLFAMPLSSFMAILSALAVFTICGLLSDDSSDETAGKRSKSSANSSAQAMLHRRQRRATTMPYHSCK